MNRLTDNDKNFGPFTFAKWAKRVSIEFSTGDDEERSYRNRLLCSAFGVVLRVALPNIIPPFRIKHEANWDSATVARLGRNHYFETHERRFGFTLSDMGNGYDFLQIHYGANTHDSSTDRTWSKHLPWKQWDCVRHSLYTPEGKCFYTEPHWKKARVNKAKHCFEVKDTCPASYFKFQDYDGEIITATCHIEEREWHKGTGWFTWLKWFTKPKIRRSLDIRFSAEVGTEKGSWKGGTIGTGCDMLEGDTPEKAFRHFCDKDHERKGRKFKLQFLEQCLAPISK
jgi:hypothetical protein